MTSLRVLGCTGNEMCTATEQHVSSCPLNPMAGRAKQIKEALSQWVWKDADAPPLDVGAQWQVARFLAAQEDERGVAEVAAAVEAVAADPWEARNWGELARYQEGVTRHGAVGYGLFVRVDDLRAALADPAGALAKHDAEVLRAAADDYLTGHYYDHFRKWLRERADRIAGDQS